MSKKRPVEISVTTIFDGKQSEQQAFVDLILNKSQKYREAKMIDLNPAKGYNYDKVFSTATLPSAKLAQVPPDIFPELDVHVS